MNKLSINKNEITIHSACNVDSTILNEFYRQAYPERINYLKTNWRWLNRTEFLDNNIPLVLVFNKQVIAHLGMIPFKALIGGNKYLASWYIDFKILPKFQRQGLGKIMIGEFTKLTDCCLATGCTPSSFRAFIKSGWVESKNTYLHLNFLLPFNHPFFTRKFPAFICKILNGITYPLFYFVYIKHSVGISSYQLNKLTEISFENFYNCYSKNKMLSENQVVPIRDRLYTQWRVLNSSNKDKYYIYKNEKFSSLVSFNNNHGQYIDILWVSNSNDKLEIVKMISSLGIYGMKKGFSYIRFYTTNPVLSKYIKNKTRSFIRRPIFVYFSKNKLLLEKLKKINWDFELIDNDFERFN